MKERPIIFSAEMVRAILEGRKTQTRRVVTVPVRGGKRCAPYPPWYCESDGQLLYQDECGEYHAMSDRCPYGRPGDRLWVRERWHYDDWTEDGYPWIRYFADNKCEFCGRIPDEWSDRLSDIWAELSSDFDRKGRACDERWRSARFMPRWASRITLEVVNVRVERLGDITTHDCLCEGMDAKPDDNGHLIAAAIPGSDEGDDEIKERFADLWDSINAKRGFGWDTDPWVWAVEFKRLEAAQTKEGDI